jgi:hypothetical protein
VSYDGPASCPICGKTVPGDDDVRERRWRHLDIYEFEAYVVVQVLVLSAPRMASGRLRCLGARAAAGPLGWLRPQA